MRVIDAARSAKSVVVLLPLSVPYIVDGDTRILVHFIDYSTCLVCATVSVISCV